MKSTTNKIISFLVMIVLILSVTGCKSGKNSLVGTWEVDCVEIEGSKFTLSELEAMGDDSMSKIQIIIKDGGKASLIKDGSGDLVNWEKTEERVKIGEQECSIVNGMICLEMNSNKIYFKKSANQYTTSSNKDFENKEETIIIKESPDKYTWYIKNYVGKNCASLGYTSLGGDRMDKYGAGIMELIFVTKDGTYIDIESDEELKNYIVTGQNIPANSELKLTFKKDNEGQEYDNLVDYQTYEQIVLSVKKIGDLKDVDFKLTKINPSLDKYHWYIADYVGRNLANCGYTSLGGDLMDKYGAAVVELIIVSDDGSYIDPKDRETLKKYVVISQNVLPNTELSLIFSKDSSGIEYDNLVDIQNIEEIELIVKSIQ